MAAADVFRTSGVSLEPAAAGCPPLPCSAAPNRGRASSAVSVQLTAQSRGHGSTSACQATQRGSRPRPACGRFLNAGLCVQALRCSKLVSALAAELRSRRHLRSTGRAEGFLGQFPAALRAEFRVAFQRDAAVRASGSYPGSPALFLKSLPVFFGHL